MRCGDGDCDDWSRSGGVPAQGFEVKSSFAII